MLCMFLELTNDSANVLFIKLACYTLSSYEQKRICFIKMSNNLWQLASFKASPATKLAKSQSCLGALGWPIRFRHVAPLEAVWTRPWKTKT